ncbi:MAG: glycosyltransferase, partial [Pseudomonadota bacterium]|nr:glycosyltransferase [Pseudomonadota bacterium]
PLPMLHQGAPDPADSSDLPGHLLPADDGALPLWRALPPPPADLRCVVVMPVRDEAAGIDTALQALATQILSTGARSAAGETPRFEIVVLANNCSDDTAARARAVAQRQPSLGLHVVEADLPQPLANVGYARGQLFDEACRRLQLAGHPRGVIASTDGDTRVEPDWLQGILDEIDQGADAVGGRILTDDCAGLGPAALRMQRADATHALLQSRLASLIDPDGHDPWPRHHQHFGASLAVTAEAYRAAGGMPKVDVLEDMALVRALQRADRRVRHSPRVRVRTSSRLDGRASVGLSWQLRQWAQAEAKAHSDALDDAARDLPDPLVLRALHWQTMLQARHRLRKAWPQGATDPALQGTVAAGLGLPHAEVADRVAQADGFGSLWNDLETAATHKRHREGDLEPLSQAMAALRLAVRLAARLAVLPVADLAVSLAPSIVQGASSSGGSTPGWSKTSSR